MLVPEPHFMFGYIYLNLSPTLTRHNWTSAIDYLAQHYASAWKPVQFVLQCSRFVSYSSEGLGVSSPLLRERVKTWSLINLFELYLTTTSVRTGRGCSCTLFRLEASHVPYLNISHIAEKYGPYAVSHPYPLFNCFGIYGLFLG